MTIEVTDTRGGSAGNLVTRRELIPTDEPNNRRTEGVFEESNISSKLE